MILGKLDETSISMFKDVTSFTGYLQASVGGINDVYKYLTTICDRMKRWLLIYSQLLLLIILFFNPFSYCFICLVVFVETVHKALFMISVNIHNRINRIRNMCLEIALRLGLFNIILDFFNFISTVLRVFSY